MKNNKRFPLLLTVALSCSLVAVPLTGVSWAQQVPPANFVQAKHIDVLKSDAGFKEENDACRALALGGTKEAVPALAPLLLDEKLSHMARYALEQIDGPEAATALREALGKAKGLPLIGVIASVGALRDASAIPALTAILNGTDTEAADAAAHSLGRIGGSAATKPLLAALAKPTFFVYDGLLRGALSVPSAEAAAIYDAVRKPTSPKWVQLTALRGAILSRQDKGLPLLLETVTGTDEGLALAAIQAAREFPTSAGAKLLAANLDKLDVERKILAIQAIGDRRDTSTGAPVLAIAKKSEGRLRTASIKAVVQIGDVSAVPLLGELATGNDDEAAKAARAGLGTMKGKEVEALIAAMLQTGAPKARVVATDLVVQRKMAQAMPQLLKGAVDADASVAAASLSALGNIAGSAEVPAIIKVLAGGTAIPAAENALTTIFQRQRDAASADALSAALPAASVPVKASLLRLMRRVGGPKALGEVRKALTDANGEVKDTAARTLCDWPTADAIPDLLEMAKNPPSPALKVLSLRGALRLAPLGEATPTQKVALVKAALAIIERPDEKRLAWAALGSIPSAESLALVMAELANPALRVESVQAAIAIGVELTKTEPALVSEAMKQVLKSTEDKGLQKRAQALVK